MRRFDHLFETDTDDRAAEAVAEANDLIVWSQLPHFGRFIEKIRSRAYKQMEVGDQLTMVREITTANVYKQLHDELMAEINRAKQTVEIHKGTRDV